MPTKSVAKALDILEVVCSSGTSLGLRQVSDAFALPSPTAYRLLQTFVQSAGTSNSWLCASEFQPSSPHPLLACWPCLLGSSQA
jgi:hypothetical protein